MIRSTVEKSLNLYQNRPVFLHTRPTCSELPCSWVFNNVIGSIWVYTIPICISNLKRNQNKHYLYQDRWNVDWRNLWGFLSKTHKYWNVSCVWFWSKYHLHAYVLFLKSWLVCPLQSYHRWTNALERSSYLDMIFVLKNVSEHASHGNSISSITF